MSVARANRHTQVLDTRNAGTEIELSDPEVIHALEEFPSEKLSVAVNQEVGENASFNDDQPVFVSETSWRARGRIVTTNGWDIRLEEQPTVLDVRTQPEPVAPVQYLAGRRVAHVRTASAWRCRARLYQVARCVRTPARVAALLIAFAVIWGGIAVTRRLATPSVAELGDVTGRPLLMLAVTHAPGVAETRPPSVDRTPPSEVVVSPMRLRAAVKVPSVSTSDRASVVVNEARELEPRLQRAQLPERGSWPPASDAVPELNPVPQAAATGGRVEPVSSPPLATAVRMADVPLLPAPAAAVLRADSASRPVEAQSDAVDDRAIEAVLSRYRVALNDLDPDAARAVWPAVDVNGLGRAFEQLESQHVGFDECEIVISGALAQAECRGAVNYVPRIGKRHGRVEPRQWRIDLYKSDAGWWISSVAAR